MTVAAQTRAVRIALGIVNTSTPLVAEANDLRAAILDPHAPARAHARILLEEAPAPLFADLVREGFVTWPELAAATHRYPGMNHETAAWIRDMARLALA
jgi:hypothetical protein